MRMMPSCIDMTWIWTDSAASDLADTMRAADGLAIVIYAAATLCPGTVTIARASRIWSAPSANAEAATANAAMPNKILVNPAFCILR